MPIRHHVAAMSVGIVDGLAMADLAYEEDFAAEVDLNLVMTKEGAWVELQGTAEGEPFSSEQLQAMLDAGRASLPSVIAAQEKAMESRE